jgi:hypothetical protein
MMEYYSHRNTPSVVVYDFFAPGAADAADKLGCPSICIFPNASVTINPSLVLPTADRICDIVRHKYWCVAMNLGEAIGARYLLYKRNCVRSDRGLPPLIEQDIFPCKTMQHMTVASTGLGFEFADKVIQLSPLFRMVGPSLPSSSSSSSSSSSKTSPQTIDEDLSEWIDLQIAHKRYIVYVAFGAVFSHTETSVALLQKQLEGLSKDNNVAILWALPESQQGWLNDPLPKNWKVERFAPQLYLLASGKISVFVSHCGSNSVNESLLNKVPIVCCPGFADQPGNAVRIENVGVGKIARGGIIGVEEALRDVLFSKEESTVLDGQSKKSSSYKQNCERLCKIWENLGGANRAAIIIEEVGQFGYDYMKPNLHRTKWSRLVALCAISGIGAAVLLGKTKHPFQIRR